MSLLFKMSFASVYPLYLTKVTRKGRTQAELDQGLTSQQAAPVPLVEEGAEAPLAPQIGEILIDNKSPMNIRAKDLIIDSSGGFAKYNGTYLKSNADIASFNRDVKTGLNITVDSIDTRGGGPAEALPTIKILNSYVSTGVVSANPVIATAPDGSSADLRQDQMRAPEIRVNGLAYNKLGSILLDNTSGSISVIAEDALYTPRLDGLEITVNSGKNFVLSSPTVSQSIGGSPENLYAVAYNDDQQNKLNNMGVVRCGTARAGSPASTSFSSNCLRNGTGGIYASGGIFLGARYLNINGTIQSGQSDYAVTLTDASVGARINSWKTEWPRNRSRSPLLQISGRLSTDSELDVTKRFENGTITQTQRDNELAAIAARRKEPTSPAVWSKWWAPSSTPAVAWCGRSMGLHVLTSTTKRLMAWICWAWTPVAMQAWFASPT